MVNLQKDLEKYIFDLTLQNKERAEQINGGGSSEYGKTVLVTEYNLTMVFIRTLTKIIKNNTTKL